MKYVEGIVFVIICGVIIGSCIAIGKRNTANDCVVVCGEGNVDNCGFYTVNCKD
jgi:hypothetical protein